MSGFLTLFVLKNNFRLLKDDDAITTYTFNSGVAQHFFCKHCGVKSYYFPRSHPDGLTVKVNCIKLESIERIEETAFDGQNWEQKVSELSPLSN